MRVYVCASASAHMCVCVCRYQVHASVSLCVCVLLKTCAACAGIIFSSLAAHFLLKRVCQRDCMLALSALTHSLHLSASPSSFHSLSGSHLASLAELPCPAWDLRLHTLELTLSNC